MAEEDELARGAYQDFLEDALNDPVKYIKHDSNAHEGPASFRMVAEFGMESYGQYWLLVELLTSRRGHYYDVTDDYGWLALSRDMGRLMPMSTDDCKEFVGMLYELDLINREQYDELGRVTISRVLRDALAYAEGVASKKLGAWKTNRKKMFGKG